MRAFPPENDHNNHDNHPDHNHLLSALGDNGLGGMREAKTIIFLIKTESDF